MTKSAYIARLETLRYNLETNRKYWSEHEIELVKQRIRDYTDFIDTLTRIGL